MAVNSSRSIAIRNTGDVVSNQTFSAADNATAPGDIDLVALTTGANTITFPTGYKGATIIMPAGNTTLVTLKGVTGDTGVPLHKTDPSSIGLDSSGTSFCLTAAADMNVRILWT